MSKSLAKKLAQIKPGTLFVGVDLALDKNVTVVLDAGARQLDRFAFPHDREGYDDFRQRLADVCARHQASGVLIGMEPTNYYWKLLSSYLERHDLAYRLVNPYTVKKRREGDHLDRSRDDPRDAFTIADLLRTGKFTETQRLHGLYAELRNLVAHYARLQGDIGRQKTLLRTAVGQLFPELKQVFQDFSGHTARAMLCYHASAHQVAGLSLADFIAGVRADFQGTRLHLAKLRHAHRLATSSIGLQEETHALQLMTRLHLEYLAGLQGQLQQVEQTLVATFLALPEAPYLLSIPGLGLMTAAIILAEIGDPRRYRNGRQLIKLAGTQPAPNTSGRKTRSATPMSGQGRPRLRTALYFACLRLVQRDEAFARTYQRLQQRDKNPLTGMQALGVLMNKLLRIVWAVIRDQTSYDQARAS
jgi:transposase